MSWLVWRQHRQQALFGAATFALVACLLLLTGMHMHSVFDSSGLGRCLSGRGDCSNAQSAFESRFGTLRQLVPFFMVLPLLLGLFWGAPLIARDLEQGTHLFIWTQGVTRLRWLSSKLLALVLLALALAAAYAVLTRSSLGAGRAGAAAARRRRRRAIARAAGASSRVRLRAAGRRPGG